MLRFSHRLSWSLACCAAFTMVVNSSGSVLGQAGLRESLERLDKDGDGDIEPHEITPLARPYLERITRSRRMSIDRPNSIEKLQEAARIHHALQNGISGRDVRPEGESTVKPFGPAPDEPLVPEFGLAEVKYPYTQDDLDFADRTLRSHDENRDGYIDRAEAAGNKWTHRNPFDDDLNQDDRLSRLELAQRYARRRLLDDVSDELRQKAWRTGGEIRSSERQEDDRRSEWWRRRSSSYWLTASVMERFDLNKNGRLEQGESGALGMPTAQIDVDRDGDMSRSELHDFLTNMQNEAGDPSQGIPGWFYELDANRDRQVAMSEFTSEWTYEKLQEFESLDTNGDGLLTSEEVAGSKAMVGGSYSNRIAQVVPPGGTIISEIDVAEDFLIGDVNVQLSITHTRASHLDAYLTGPDGQRIELFTEVGGNDDHFDQTIFDDQSRYPITKARPPFRGTFMPEGLLKRQPSLSDFNGKNAQGVWQLVIRATRSDRFGMLHNWSLLFRPVDDMLDQPATAPVDDGPQPGEISSGLPVERQPQPDSTASQVRFLPPRPANIDYEAIGRRMDAAVQAGRMTKEQVRQAWISIKSKAKGVQGGDDRQEWGGKEAQGRDQQSKFGLPAKADIRLLGKP